VRGDFFRDIHLRDFHEEQAVDYDDAWKELLDGLASNDFQFLKMIYVEGYSNKRYSPRGRALDPAPTVRLQGRALWY
jgi:hypothetical protein